MAEFTQVATNEDIAAIADAIRYAEGSEADMTIAAMPAKIRALKKTLVEKTITENGEYLPVSDNADGYSKVTVREGTLAKIFNRTVTELYPEDMPGLVQTTQQQGFTGTQLTRLEFPEGFTTVGRSSCNCPQLVTLVLPSTLELIDEYAFSMCQALRNVYFRGTIAQYRAVRKRAYCWNMTTFQYVHCSDGDVTPG